MEAIIRARLKKIIGIILIILGLILHLIPLFPAGWIIVLGLELAGLRLLVQDKLVGRWEKFKDSFNKR